VGDAATSSSSSSTSSVVDQQQSLLQEERASGPSGTSVLASFAVAQSATAVGGTPPQSNENSDRTKEYYQDQYSSLLRYLLDHTLFPPCGAPLDSLRVRKHGHSTIVHSPRNDEITKSTTMQTVNVESFLAADAATFCSPGIYSFLLANEGRKLGDKTESGGWGTATDNGACHSTDNDTWGLFGSLFSSSSSGGVTLSELLLGSSLDASPWDSSGGGGGGRNDKRNSVWIDLQVSPSCFVAGAGSSDSNGGEEGCSVKVTRGASYRIALPSPSRGNRKNTNDELGSRERAHNTLNLSLGDLLLGHETLRHSLSAEKEGWKAWYPCPLSDSSRVVMHLPEGYVTATNDGVVAISDGGDSHTRTMEFDTLAWKDGYIDLAAPWAQLYPSNMKENDEKHALSMATPSSLFGISRTVHRPLGVSSSGTLVTVLNYDQLKSSDRGQSQIVKVQSLDVLPGTLIKPRMRTLQMSLYRGGGAGGDRFVPPPPNAHDQLCECSYNATDSLSVDTSIGDDASSDQCGLICHKKLSLSELQDHQLILHSDGTVLLERTIHLHPDSSLWMTVDFDEAYLPFQKFPADANRGVDAFPARATFTPVLPPSSLSSSSSSTTAPTEALSSITLYSPSLLLLPPVPDMSMPFNVISLSCTLWAFALGSTINILVRRGTESVKRDLTGEKEKRPLDKLKEKLQEKGRKLKEKVRWMKGKLGKKKGDGEVIE